MEDKQQCRKQTVLSCLEVAGGLPSFLALVISFLNTRTTLVLMDAIDSGGNLLRNSLVMYISILLYKDLRYTYNYGVGKIEATSTLACDFLMAASLLISMGLAVKDFFLPHSAGSFLIYVLLLKVLNVLGDLFIWWREHRLLKKSDCLLLRAKVAAAVKNTLFDSVALAALLVMQLCKNARWTWYISPVVSIGLGVYLLIGTFGRIRQSIRVILDKTADEAQQLAILKALSSIDGAYDEFREARSHVSSGRLCVDLNLGFPEDKTYAQLQETADKAYEVLSQTVSKCEVSLIIPARQNAEVSQPET